jgi:alpha-glucosidase
MSSYSPINVRQFTPNLGQWTSLTQVANFQQTGASIQLQMQSGPGPLITFLSPTVFRVRFNGLGNYTADNSVAVVDRDFGFDPMQLKIQASDTTIEIDTGVIRVLINRNPYSLSVFRGDQQIHADTPTYNIVYIPGAEVVANFKAYPSGARYYAFGEKAGSTLQKNQYTMTFLNYDNFSYLQGPLPSNNQPGPLNPSEPLYCSVPFLVETNPTPAQGTRYSYGLFFDNPSQSFFNLGSNDYSDMDNKYYFGALYGDLDYYFLYGNEIPDVLNSYTHLTGRAAMPPNYVFGFHQGCYGYFSRDILLQAAYAYRSAKIPIDGLHIDVDFQNNYRTFTSSNLKFPQAKEMFDQLHAAGFKCSTNITPLVATAEQDETGNIVPYDTLNSGLALQVAGQPKGAFLYDSRVGENPSTDFFEGTVDYGLNLGSNPFRSFPYNPNPDGSVELEADGYYPDLGRPEVQTWWGNQYEYLVNTLGLDMIWQDMTCPAIQHNAETPDLTLPYNLLLTQFGGLTPNAKVHNAYPLNLLKATYEGLQRLRPKQRPFIIARGGYAGMQRYAALWTGDSASSWDFLRINIPEVLNLGLSGIPITGCDIGGFATGSGTTQSFYIANSKVMEGITNYELLTRWMTLGAFLPWFRNHYNGYNKQFQEPYAYGEPVPTNCRKFIELRYRMFHVFYSAMYEATQTGMPIARALFLNDPQDPNVYNYADDQFFVGKDFLIAPIVDQHETLESPTVPLRDVYVPSGSQWYAFKNNQAPLDAPVPGGTLIRNWYAPLDQVPLYVRAGAILPIRELEQYIGELAENPITFNIYPGPDSSFTLYQDDGISAPVASGQAIASRITCITHTAIAGGQQVRLQRIQDQYTPPEKFCFVAFLGTNPPKTVSAIGQALPNVLDSSTLWTAPASAYYYNADLQITFVKLFDTVPDQTLEVTF